MRRAAAAAAARSIRRSRPTAKCRATPRCRQRPRKLVLPHSQLEGEANVLIMPNLDAANIAYQMIKTLADALPVGPILIGPARPAHILTPAVTARGVLNMTAVAAVEAQERAGRQQPSLVRLARSVSLARAGCFPAVALLDSSPI